MRILQSLLRKQGYTAIPLVRTQLGHLVIRISVGEVVTTFILDTGAGTTVIAKEFAEEQKLALVKTSLYGGGVGSSQLDIYEVPPIKLKLSEFVLTDAKLFALDLEHVKALFLAKGENCIPTGVIGGDILTSHKAIIDYENLLLYLN